MAQRDLADALGVSLGKANYCLKALLEKGLIKMHNFRNSENKRAYAYLLTPAGVSTKAELTVRFLKHKMDEYERLKVEIACLRQEITTSTEQGLCGETATHHGHPAAANKDPCKGGRS